MAAGRKEDLEVVAFEDERDEEVMAELSIMLHTFHVLSSHLYIPPSQRYFYPSLWLVCERARFNFSVSPHRAPRLLFSQISLSKGEKILFQTQIKQDSGCGVPLKQ